jgi:hypothetical protein
MAMGLRGGRAGTKVAILAAALWWPSCGDAGNPAPASPAPDVAALIRHREDALARAKVWQEPSAPIAQADLRSDPPGRFQASDEVVCRYQPRFTPGQTPKVYCAVPDGHVIKVKYGKLNAEPRTEPAASRLLAALGFGADRMFVVKSLRCLGCPAYPHPKWGPLNLLFARAGGSVRFADVSIEDPLPGRSIEAGETEGWAWHELEKIDPARGGASRAERDALSLMAVFLAHWDNKARNQRLVCLPGGDTANGGCSRPFAYIQDVGATFGPKGLNLEAWRATPVWSDEAACRVSMKLLPYQGATFPDTVISEAGRRFLADLLKQLRPQQVRDLFTASGFTEFARSSAAGRDVGNWVAAFEDKVRQIADRPACPEP